MTAAGELRLLPPEGELLRACLDPARLDPWRRLEWVLDAAAVLDSLDRPLDSVLLVRQAVDRRAVAATADAFRYLCEMRGYEAVRPTLAALAAHHPDLRERLATRLEGSTGQLLGRHAPARLAVHIRSHPSDSLARTLVSAPATLREEWQLERRRDLPRALASKLAARLPRPGRPV